MRFSEYQKTARKTAIYPNRGNNIAYPTLGLAGESGEVAEKVKKVIRDKGGVVDDKLMARVGADKYKDCLAKLHATEMTFTGKSMKAMVYV